MVEYNGAQHHYMLQDIGAAHLYRYGYNSAQHYYN